MTQILFGQSYYLRFDPKLHAAMQPYPPLGTLYAASVLRERGWDVALFDAMLAPSEEAWAQALEEHRPDYAVLFDDNFNYLSKMCLLNMRQAAFRMIRMAKERGHTVIVCSADATDHPERYLAQGADYVLLGEGEETLAELLERLPAPGAPLPEPEGILGLATQGPNGPIRTPRRPVIRDVDALPFPAWDLVDVERYRRIWLERHGYFSMNMVTTRGCPYHCNWCAKPIWGQRANTRSPASVAQEMRWLKETYRPDHIWFADDIMGLKPGWWPAFAEEVEAQDARIPFKCLSRADLIVRRPENVHALARAGCQIVWIGAESGSQKVLDAMDKGITVAQIYEATERLHQVGVQVAFFLQFGYPGETREDIELTLQMVRECQPDDIGISVSYPLPGTKFHAAVREQLGEKQNWVDSADLEMLYRGPFPSDFYRQLHGVVHKEFRARKSWRRLRTTPLHRWGRGELRELAAVIYRMASLPLARHRLDRLARLPHQGIAPLPHMPPAQAAAPTPQD